MKRYFLSHSSSDKPFVRQVADALGRDDVWLDEWELNAGDRLFQSIDAALGEAQIVVVFWSAHAAGSPWVEEETSFARFRKLQGEDVRVVPVRLDGAPLPNWMARLLWIDGKAGPAELVKRLRALLGQDQPTKVSGVDPAFQNRVDESAAIEDAYLAKECSVLVLAGPPGMGKSSLVRQALDTRLPQQQVVWIDLEAYNTPALVLAAIASRFGLSFPDEFLRAGRWVDYWRGHVFPMMATDRLTMVLDGVQSVAERGELGDWLEAIFLDLGRTPRADSLPLVAISSVAPELPAKVAGHTRSMTVGTLTNDDITRIIRHRLASSYPRRAATADQLRAAVAVIQGYPLGAHVWSAHAAQVGVDLALRDKATVERHLRDVVADILSQAQLSEDEVSALVVIGLLRIPLSVDSLVENLAVPADALTRLARLCLFDPRADGIVLHGLVAKYLIENIAPHKTVKAAHMRLGRYFKRQWQAGDDNLSAQVVIAGSQAYYHLNAAGLAAEAATIRWALVDEARSAARELYRFGDYETLISIGRAVAEMEGGAADPQLRFYHALALGRRGDQGDRDECESIFERLVKEYANNRHYLTGYADVLVRWRENERAKELYRRARTIAGRADPVPSTRLGELLLREGDLKSAEVFLREARERAPDDLRVVSAMAQLLHEQGKPDEALALVREGLRRRPDDIPLNHRAGVLLKSLDEPEKAVQHFLRAAVDRTSPASYTALADLYLDLGNVDAAERTIKGYPGRPDGSCLNVLGHIARRRQEFKEAERLFKKCLAVDGPSVVVFGSIAQLCLDRANVDLSYGMTEPARAHLSDMEDALVRGLEVEPRNTTLLRLREAGEDLRRRILREASKGLKK